MEIIYILNIIVAGWVGFSSLFFPQRAHNSVFSGAFIYSPSYRLVGALWSSIAIISGLGLIWPERMVVILLMQLIYKGIWLIVVTIPALMRNEKFPTAMAVFFLIWVIVLPFFIPWNFLFN